MHTYAYAYRYVITAFEVLQNWNFKFWKVNMVRFLHSRSKTYSCIECIVNHQIVTVERRYEIRNKVLNKFDKYLIKWASTALVAYVKSDYRLLSRVQFARQVLSVVALNVSDLKFSKGCSRWNCRKASNGIWSWLAHKLCTGTRTLCAVLPVHYRERATTIYTLRCCGVR